MPTQDEIQISKQRFILTGPELFRWTVTIVALMAMYFSLAKTADVDVKDNAVKAELTKLIEKNEKNIGNNTEAVQSIKADLGIIKYALGITPEQENQWRKQHKKNNLTEEQ